MKKFLFLFIVMLFVFPEYGFSQHRPDFRRGEDGPARKKLEELEKIKLIEALDLNEESAIKFFARRNEHMKRMRDIHREQEDLINQLEDKLNSGNSRESNRIIKSFLALEEKQTKEKIDFLTSLDDILTDEQISKLFIFQDRFPKEVNKVLMERRKKRF